MKWLDVQPKAIVLFERFDVFWANTWFAVWRRGMVLMHVGVHDRKSSL